MSQLIKKEPKSPETSGKPALPKKPIPPKETSEKVPVPCAVLNEKRVREIVREEIHKVELDRIKTIAQINALAREIIKKELGNDLKSNYIASLIL